MINRACSSRANRTRATWTTQNVPNNGVDLGQRETKIEKAERGGEGRIGKPVVGDSSGVALVQARTAPHAPCRAAGHNGGRWRGRRAEGDLYLLRVVMNDC